MAETPPPSPIAHRSPCTVHVPRSVFGRAGGHALVQGSPPFALAAVTALSLLHRAAIAVWSMTIGADSPYYLWTARAAADGNVQGALETSAGYHPLYSVLVAIVGVPLGDLETAGWAVAVVLGGLAVVPLYALLRPRTGRRTALVSCLLFALHPVLAMESSEIMITGTFLFFLLTALALLDGAVRDRDWALYPLGGFAAALAYLARPEGIAVAPVFAALLAGRAWKIARRTARRSPPARPESDRGAAASAGFRLAGGAVVAAATFLVFAGPYLLWLRARTGGWTITSRSSAVELMKNLRNATDGAADAALAPKGAGPFLPTVANKFIRAAYEPLIPLWLVGLWVASRRSRNGEAGSRGGVRGGRYLLAATAVLFWTPPILAFALDPYYRPSHRYLLPGVVLVLPWAADGFLAIRDALARRSPAYGLAAAAVLAAVCLGKSVNPRRADEAAFREAGAWLRAQEIPAPRRILSSSLKIAWYGDCAMVHPPAGDGRPGEGPVPARAGKTREVFTEERAAYLVVDDHVAGEWGPGFRKEIEAEGFEPVAAFGERPGVIPVRIYRLKKP